MAVSTAKVEDRVSIVRSLFCACLFVLLMVCLFDFFLARYHRLSYVLYFYVFCELKGSFNFCRFIMPMNSQVTWQPLFWLACKHPLGDNRRGFHISFLRSRKLDLCFMRSWFYAWVMCYKLFPASSVGKRFCALYVYYDNNVSLYLRPFQFVLLCSLERTSFFSALPLLLVWRDLDNKVRNGATCFWTLW